MFKLNSELIYNELKLIDKEDSIGEQETNIKETGLELIILLNALF